MTGNTERDELDVLTDLLSSAELWEDFGSGFPEFLPPRGADAILAAGYRRPRTITTQAELNSASIGVTIRDASGWILEKVEDGIWFTTGDDIPQNIANLPAVVLWEPNDG